MNGITQSRVFLSVVLPFGLGYYISYLYRTVNVVIAGQLSTDLSLSAANLGLITGVYFVVFASFQTPLGLLLDRYGPRKIQCCLLIFAVLGSIVFASTSNYFVLALARGLIGLGVSGCLMAALKANANWFPSIRLPLVNGITVAFGSLGALSATIPINYIFEIAGWRMIFYLLAAITLLLLLITYFLVPKEIERNSEPRQTLRQQIADLKIIYKSSFFWKISIVTFVHNSVYLSYQSLWMGPLLRDVAMFSSSDVAKAMFLFNVGMFVGVIGVGFLAERLQKYDIKPIAIVCLGVAGSIGIQTCFIFDCFYSKSVLCFLFGFFGSSTLLVYSVLTQRFPQRLTGRVNTAQNMLTFVAAFISQWLIGVIINYWPKLENLGYPSEAHITAFVVMIVIETLAFLYFVWPQSFYKFQVE